MLNKLFKKENTDKSLDLLVKEIVARNTNTYFLRDRIFAREINLVNKLTNNVFI